MKLKFLRRFDLDTVVSNIDIYDWTFEVVPASAQQTVAAAQPQSIIAGGGGSLVIQLKVRDYG